jgi:protein-S-isoprenylcysteine O-methyltransferase Ste14
MIGFLLVFWTLPWHGAAVWPVGPELGWAMVGLCALGLAFTWWARLHMGKLWHGGIVRMENHRVIRSGPFGLVRHPIYTGMIVALLAVAVLQARAQALLGVMLFALGFILKARLEERFLEVELPDYAEYRTRVRMIVPFLL